MGTEAMRAQWQTLRHLPGGLAPVVLGALLLLALLALLAMLLLQIDRPLSPLAVVQRTQVAPVQNWRWFRGVLEAPVAALSAATLADVKIDADLLGVLITPKVSTATLKHKGKTEQVYLLGDEVSEGMTLVEIQAQRIVVEQNGLRKQLLLKKPDALFELSSSALETSNEAGSTEQAGFRLANMFGAVPVSLDGAGGNYSSGFKLNALSAEMRSLADVEDGDVVVEVSGSSVQELMQNPAEWTSYTAQSNLPVTVIRDGREVVIYVNAASLTAKMLPMMGKN
jgi:S1-C subfamily serine protease